MIARTLYLMFALLAALALAGCSDDTTNPDSSAVTAESDAALAIATDLGADDGGLVDQLTDAVSFAGGVDLSIKSADECEGLREATYDETTGTWTITIERERGDLEVLPYASFERVYTLRFLDAAGEPQEHYTVDGEAAQTIEFAIVSGTGEHVTRRVEQELLELTGQFVITDAHTDAVTINGTYARSGANELVTDHFERTHTSTLNLQLVDVVAPRRVGRDLSEALSGTVSGTYEATITVARGDDYSEREIFREFDIELGDGEALVFMNRDRYRVRLKTGELIEE